MPLPAAPTLQVCVCYRLVNAFVSMASDILQDPAALALVPMQGQNARPTAGGMPNSKTHPKEWARFSRFCDRNGQCKEIMKGWEYRAQDMKHSVHCSVFFHLNIHPCICTSQGGQ